MVIVRSVLAGFGLFVLYVVAWQVLILLTSRGHAHGAGFYRGSAPMFLTAGVFFIAFAVFLFRR